MIGSFLTTQLPNWSRFVFYGVISVLIYQLGSVNGSRAEGEKHLAYVADLKENVRMVTKTNDRIVLKTEIEWRDRVHVIRSQGEVLIHEIPNFISKTDDDLFGVNVGFVRSYNASWSGTSAGLASESDREPSGIPLSEIAETNTYNATTCREWKELAIKLKQFYLDLQKSHANN